MLHFTVFVDVDNVPTKLFAEVRHEIERWGRANEWYFFSNSPTMTNNSWRARVCDALSIDEMKLHCVSPGKNATDMTMVIQAMDLFHAGELQALCLVTGDKDFVPLVHRLRQSKVPVYCVAGNNASKTLLATCSGFAVIGSSHKAVQRSKPPKQLTAAAQTLLDDAMAAHQDELGWAVLSDISSYLKSNSPGYAKRKWGFKTLSKVLHASGRFILQDINGQRMAKLAPVDPQAAGDLPEPLLPERVELPPRSEG